jgi:hypothetical protein
MFFNTLTILFLPVLYFSDQIQVGKTEKKCIFAA